MKFKAKYIEETIKLLTYAIKMKISFLFPSQSSKLV